MPDIMRQVGRRGGGAGGAVVRLCQATYQGEGVDGEADEPQGALLDGQVGEEGRVRLGSAVVRFREEPRLPYRDRVVQGL